MDVTPLAPFPHPPLPSLDQGGPWSMIYGCAPSLHRGVVYAGDSDGLLHLLDPRAPSYEGWCSAQVRGGYVSGGRGGDSDGLLHLLDPRAPSYEGWRSAQVRGQWYWEGGGGRQEQAYKSCS